jgi:hypothetical protein
MNKTKQDWEAEGFEVGPDDPANRESGRRTRMVSGIRLYFTPEQESQRDAEEAAEASIRSDYIANHKYKDDRRKAYGDIGDQLDMIYWDQVNDTTTFKDYVASVKAAHPKP